VAKVALYFQLPQTKPEVVVAGVYKALVVEAQVALLLLEQALQ
tara:strand:- start:335 stop:463 length:129 start_codon:yes stop_codon:yes gene_type:complete